MSAGNIFSVEENLTYQGYVFEKRHRNVRETNGGATRAQWIDVSYVVLKQSGKVVTTFDADIYFGMGNDVRFGAFSLLDRPVKEIVVSQERFRGGTQWIISLKPHRHIIFSGPHWVVGREGDDMTIVDLDHDHIYEIIFPITDFYEFQDKLPISLIPLPAIVFKYDDKAGEYLPANPLFPNYLIRGLREGDIVNSADEFNHRAMVLEKTLYLIYVGKQHEAWELYNGAYKLDDKEELRRRITNIINNQPVYKFIYNLRKRT